MKAEYINPFIQSSINIVNQTTGTTYKLGEVHLKSAPYSSSNVLVVIGFTGEISGNVVISFNNETACKIASSMMFMTVDTLDEISKSALGELCNMILGNTATLFSQSGINIDITPPTILTGDNIQLSNNKSQIISIPLSNEQGCKIDIDISYAAK